MDEHSTINTMLFIETMVFNGFHMNWFDTILDAVFSTPASTSQSSESPNDTTYCQAFFSVSASPPGFPWSTLIEGWRGRRCPAHVLRQVAAGRAPSFHGTPTVVAGSGRRGPGGRSGGRGCPAAAPPRRGCGRTVPPWHIITK